MTKLKQNQITGIISMALGFLIYHFRPFQECSWWNIFCHAGSAGSSTIFAVILVVLVVYGILSFTGFNYKKFFKEYL